MIAAAQFACALLLLPGCTQTSAPPPAEGHTPYLSIGTQLQRTSPDLAGRRFLDLLSFESPSDPVFISASQLQIETDELRAHTGRASLRLSGQGVMTVKLASLLGPQQFPGEWTIAGAYFYSDQPARVAVSLHLDGASDSSSAVPLQPGQWTAVMVDIPAAQSREARRADSASSLSFSISASGDVWCDDVILMDNTEWIVGQPQSTSTGGWSVYRKGSNFFFAGSNFKVTFPVESQPGGFILEEANSLRARLKSAGNGAQRITICSDGRSYLNGNLRALSPAIRGEPLWASQQASPAIVQVPETMGRLDRNSAGDEDNDGYNEIRAAYMLIATGPRLEATLTPRSVPVLRPTLEISGLPPGDVLVTIEGRLVEQTARLKDGTLLVELPGRIDRATTVSLRVQ